MEWESSQVGHVLFIEVVVLCTVRKQSSIPLAWILVLNLGIGSSHQHQRFNRLAIIGYTLYFNWLVSDVFIATTAFSSLQAAELFLGNLVTHSMDHSPRGRLDITCCVLEDGELVYGRKEVGW